MEFRTATPFLKHIPQPITYQSNLVVLGSCFSENIGKKLKDHKFQTLQNPFGILFQPSAIETLVNRSISENTYALDHLIRQNERWHCLDAHSSLSDTDPKKVLANLNQALADTKEGIKNASHIIITMGTAWTYRWNDSGAWVANCHKIPQKHFQKTLLSVAEITEALEKTLQHIRSINQEAQVLFSVSPVRHLKDGMIENQRSKAHLLTAIHQVIDRQEKCSYIPAYEVLMDELRDYRFYAEDMIHPSQTAIDYIWKLFYTQWMSKETQEMMKEIANIQRGLAHKPFQPNSKQHQAFLARLEQQMAAIKKQLPTIQF